MLYMDQVELRVDEMSCAACSSAVEKALAKVEGVQSVNVAFSTGRASISGTNLDGEALANAATRSGYPSQLIDEGIDPNQLATEIESRQKKNASAWKRRAIIGVAIWAPFEALHWSVGTTGHFRARGSLGSCYCASTASMVLVGGGFFTLCICRCQKIANQYGYAHYHWSICCVFLFSLYVYFKRITWHDLQHPMYFMEAAALLAIISIGHWLEATSSAKAGSLQSANC